MPNSEIDNRINPDSEARMEEVELDLNYCLL